MIEFRNVTKLFDSRTILDQVNLKIYEAQVPEGECFEFVVLAGLAEGKSGDQMETTIESAKSQQKIIARFNCETRR